jgi:hypothetical protein
MEHLPDASHYNSLRIMYTNPLRTSQEIHYISATKPNRLMLFRETVAVYCVYTVWAECRVLIC